MYPNLIDRTKALLIDGVILIVLIIITSDILTHFVNIPDYLKIGLFIVYFLLYEPILLCTKGATIGHHYAGIKVKKYSNTDANISFFSGIIRFTLKGLLGWISFISFFASDNKRAIHDFASSSIVLYK